MKKYKLIKTYPGSPELDTIITQKKNGTYEINNIVESANEVVNYPEFWQEVVEKDYEILNYSKPSNRFSISLLKRDSSWDIHSVKRLSDGEIFTIGDKVNIKDLKNINICEFCITGNIIKINCLIKDDFCVDDILLKNISKVKNLPPR